MRVVTSLRYSVTSAVPIRRPPPCRSPCRAAGAGRGHAVGPRVLADEPQEDPLEADVAAASSCSSRPAANARGADLAGGDPAQHERRRGRGSAASARRGPTSRRAATSAASPAASGEVTRTVGSARRGQLGQRRGVHEAAAGDDDDVVDRLLDLGQHVAGHQHGAALGGEVPQERRAASAMPSGSRPLAGSSSSRTPGSPSRVVARARRWRMPSEKPPTRRFARAGQADELEHLAGSARRRRRPAARTRAGGRSALRPGWKLAASSAAPDRAHRPGEVGVGAPPIVAVPASAGRGRAASAASSSCRRRWGRGTR